jgi:predicted nucleotidyltransferase
VVAERTFGLELLVVFGSRARGDARQGSDWDFAYLGAASLDANRLNAELSLALRTDRVDLADLARAGGLLRFRAARDGVPVYESREGTFRDFWFDAVQFWCDAGPVLDVSYDAVLARLDR